MTQSALMHKAIQSIAVGPDRGRDISQTDAEQIMGAILQGNIDPIQTAVFLIALRMKRESLVEFRGLFQGLQSEVEQVTAEVDSLTCLADPFDGYVRHIPMSPFLPAVLSACGMSVLMHGVETVGPKHGVTAHKVYKLAGLPTLENAHSAAKSIQQHGWGYLDQSQYLPSLYALLPLRDKIIKRTAITTLERLLMPVRGRDKTHMVLGYVHKAYPEIYAEVAEQAGYDTVLLVKGVEGGLTPGLSKPLRRFFTDCRQNNTEKLQKELVDEHNAQQADTNAVAAPRQPAKPPLRLVCNKG